MSLDAILIAILTIAFLAIVVAQARWLNDEPAIFKRRRRRAASFFGLLILGLGLVRYVAVGGADWLLAPDEDGSWRAVMIDGQPVATREFTIGIKGGRVLGGADDCNHWGFEDEEELDKPLGERMIVSTLALCVEDDAVRRAYRMVAMSDARPVLRPDGSLHLAAAGHRAILRRCVIRELLEGNSRITRCVIEAP